MSATAPTLTTERLILRAGRPGDFDASVALWADPDVVRYIGGKPSSRLRTWGRLLQMSGLWPLLGYGYWTIEERAGGAFVGQAGLADFKREMTPGIDGVPEAGYVLAPAFHGQGYASEAMSAVMSWADTHLDAPRTCALIHPDNAGSLRVAAKLGFAEPEPARLEGEQIVLLWRARRA